MLELQAQRAPVVLQPAQFTFEELALPAQLAALLLGARRNANGFEFVRVPFPMTREAHAQFARIEPIILAPSFQRQAHGRGHERVRPGRDQFVVQRVAKATRFVHGMHFVSCGALFLDPGEQLRAGELLRGRKGAPIALDGRDDVVEIHIQPQREDVAPRRQRSIAFGLELR
jgi:hypothetical protein